MRQLSKWRSGRCGALLVEMHWYGREGEADKVDEDKVVGWQLVEDRVRVTEVLNYVCRNGGAGRSEVRIWWKLFVTNA